jgi:hypothetical protein
MRGTVRILLFLFVAPLVGACSHKQALPSEAAGHDRQTELRRQQDCADPDWKAANLGLWYNVCRPDAF